MFCGKCGAEVQNNASFCPNCGNKIETASISNKTNLNCGSRKGLKIIVSILTVIVTIVAVVMIAIVVIRESGYEKTYKSNDLNEEFTPSQSAKIPASSDKYDEILVSGDGYNIVRKHVESYDRSYDEYGIIMDSGEWSTEMSGDNYIANAVQSLMSDGYLEAYYKPEFYYLGESMFTACCSCAVLDVTYIPDGYLGSYAMHGVCQVINPEKKIAFGAGGYLITEYKNGYTFTKTGNVGKVVRYDKEGNGKTFVQATDNPYIGHISSGLIYIDKKFYDVETAELRIDLSEYDLELNGYEKCTNGGNLSFDENGECYFKFYNPAKKLYGVTINKKGEFINEPELLE